MHDVLIYSSLYPSAFNPFHGIFVREVTRTLVVRVHAVRVVAPLDGRHCLAGFIKKREELHDGGVTVLHPLFWTIPGLFKQWDARFLYYWTRRAMASQRRDISLIHAHYAYPEACAAYMFAREWNIPLVVTVHGSDINVIARDPARQPLIVDTLKRADAVVAVSKKLKEKVAALTQRAEGIYHIPNGMDITQFYPGSQSRARKRLGLLRWKKIIVFAGRLEPVKGLDRLIRAVSDLDPSVGLVILGDGSLKKVLNLQVHELGIKGQVQFCGAVPHDELVDYFQAADLLALASHSEGWPTIIPEAMACGIPVVAPPVGGVPEIIEDQRLGILTEDNRAASLRDALKRALGTSWDGDYICQYARQFTWDVVADAYVALYDRITGKIRERV